MAANQPLINIERARWLELWREFDDPNGFDPNGCKFWISGFRSDELIGNPYSITDAYFEQVFASVIGIGPDISPHPHTREKARLKAFRGVGAILKVDPNYIIEMRDSDPGPPEVEPPTPPLDHRSLTPTDLLNMTIDYNEVIVRLTNHAQAVELIGLFVFEEEQTTREGQAIIARARELGLPVLIIDQQNCCIYSMDKSRTD